MTSTAGSHLRRLDASASRRSSPRRSPAPARAIHHGARVVVVANATPTTVEILGHGTYQHSTAPADVTHRLATALASADRVAVDYEPMLEALTRYMSSTRAREFRSHFHSRNGAWRARPVIERAGELAASIRSNHRVQLDSGEVVGLDGYRAVPAADFPTYAEGCTVVNVRGRAASTGVR